MTHSLWKTRAQLLEESLPDLEDLAMAPLGSDQVPAAGPGEFDLADAVAQLERNVAGAVPQLRTAGLARALHPHGDN